ncbi:MAG: 4Fe-4S double cluster binding domain-containing protein [Acidobacteriota bacterium]
MKTTEQELCRHLKRNGYQARLVPIDHLSDLSEAIATHHALGAFDEEFFQEQLTGLSFRPPDELASVRSLIIAALPAPQVRVVFAWKERRLRLILPPTYVRYRATLKRVENEVAAFLEPRGFRVAQTALPLKLLAVRSGLASYGKNNICFVPGMGSFLQLAGCYSDLPCSGDSWRELEMMFRCEKCQACLRACPTGAITRDRFLLHAERCLTFHNERAAAFPAWIDPSWHHCLVGCMQCQQVCPENKAFLPWVVEGEQFTEEETGLLLQGPEVDELPEKTRAKVRNLGLSEGWAVLSRNLATILERL